MGRPHPTQYVWRAALDVTGTSRKEFLSRPWTWLFPPHVQAHHLIKREYNYHPGFPGLACAFQLAGQLMTRDVEPLAKPSPPPLLRVKHTEARGGATQFVRRGMSGQMAGAVLSFDHVELPIAQMEREGKDMIKSRISTL